MFIKGLILNIYQKCDDVLGILKKHKEFEKSLQTFCLCWKVSVANCQELKVKLYEKKKPSGSVLNSFSQSDKLHIMRDFWE